MEAKLDKEEKQVVGDYPLPIMHPSIFGPLIGLEPKSIKTGFDKGIWPFIQFKKGGTRYVNLLKLEEMCANVGHSGVVK